jgi:hypothetical protein
VAWRGVQALAWQFPTLPAAWNASGWPGKGKPLWIQNLLHLVFKRLMNTKDSEAGAERQVFFDPPQTPVKTTTKTGRWSVAGGISPYVPRTIHRVVHTNAADER